MTLTLIGAERADDAGTPLALLPLAGMPLVEHQARRATAAGAAAVMILNETPNADLIAVIARLRQDGIAAERIETLGSVEWASDVLMLADGCLPEPRLIAGLLAASAPCVATIADAPGLDRYERIDATARWAGAALMPAGMVAETAALPEGWDPISTLLRRAVQEGAARIDAAIPPLLAERTSDLAGAERAMIVTSRIGHEDLIGRHLFTPIEDRLLPWLLDQQVEPAVLATGSAVLALISGLMALLGLRWPVLIALLIVGPIATMARRLARMQSRPIANARPLGHARRAGGALALLGLGWSLTTETDQWGWLLVGAIAIAGLSGLAVERPAPRPQWYASTRTLAWDMLPFALLGRWGLGLSILALHAALSFAAALAARRADQRVSSGG